MLPAQCYFCPSVSDYFLLLSTLSLFYISSSLYSPPPILLTFLYLSSHTSPFSFSSILPFLLPYFSPPSVPCSSSCHCSPFFASPPPFVEITPIHLNLLDQSLQSQQTFPTKRRLNPGMTRLRYCILDKTNDGRLLLTFLLYCRSS